MAWYRSWDTVTEFFGGVEMKRSSDCEMCVRLNVASRFGERLATDGLDVKCLDISFIRKKVTVLTFLIHVFIMNLRILS